MSLDLHVNFTINEVAHNLRLEAAHAPLRVQRGKRGQRAKPGSWIAFDDADGYVSVYCQGQDSAETAGLAPGDVVTVTATPPQEP